MNEHVKVKLNQNLSTHSCERLISVHYSCMFIFMIFVFYIYSMRHHFMLTVNAHSFSAVATAQSVYEKV